MTRKPSFFCACKAAKPGISSSHAAQQKYLYRRISLTSPAYGIDPDFLLRGFGTEPRVRLSVRKAHGFAEATDLDRKSGGS